MRSNAEPSYPPFGPLPEQRYASSNLVSSWGVLSMTILGNWPTNSCAHQRTAITPAVPLKLSKSLLNANAPIASLLEPRLFVDHCSQLLSGSCSSHVLSIAKHESSADPAKRQYKA